MTAVTTSADVHCPLVDEMRQRLTGCASVPGRWRKDVQRRLLRKSDLSSIGHLRLANEDDLRVAFATLGSPLVVKPVTGVASRDVWLRHSIADAEAFLAGLAARRRPITNFTIETFVTGRVPEAAPHLADYVSVELFVGAGRHSAFVTDRPPLAWLCRETGIVAPTSVDLETEKRLIEAALGAHRALGLGDGAFHIAMKATSERPEVIEVNGRLGGYVRRVVMYASGVDVGVTALDCSLGRVPVMDLPWEHSVMGLLLQSPSTATRLASTPSRKDVLSRPGVIAAEPLSKPDSGQLDWRVGTGGAAVKLWLAAETAAGLRTVSTEFAWWFSDASVFVGADGERVVDPEWLDRFAGDIGRHTDNDA